MTEYTLKYQEPHKHFLYVKAVFNVTNKDEIQLQFPTWRPGRYEKADFVKNINSWKVLDDSGKTLQTEKKTKDSWVVSCANTEKVIVQYRYFAFELNAGSTYIDQDHFYVNPVNCCIYEKDKETEPCQVTLDIPASFEVASAQNFSEGTAQFGSYHEWVDNPVIASTQLQHQTYESHGVQFHIWFNGELIVDWGKILRDFQKFTDAQITTFKEFPVREYHYMYQVVPYQLYHGVEHQHCTVCALGPSYQVMRDLYVEFLGVSSHELYHTWNVKAIRPVEMYPYDYSRENYTKLGYIAEGVTTYMGDLFLWKSGVFDDDQFFKVFQGQINKHLSNLGRFNHSVADSSFDTWLDGYVKGIPERKVSIYTEGCLISFMIDTLIMRATENKKSLHDVMRNLFFNYALKNKGVSEADYKKEIESVSGQNFDTFFEQYVNGNHAYESLLYECLEYVGLALELTPSKDKAAALLGIKTLKAGKITVVDEVYPGSTADLMGLSIKDELIALNGFKIEGNLNEWLSYFEDEKMELTFFRKNKLMTVAVPQTNKNYYLRYTLQPLDNISKVQQKAYQKWSTM